MLARTPRSMWSNQPNKHTKPHTPQNRTSATKMKNSPLSGTNLDTWPNLIQKSYQFNIVLKVIELFCSPIYLGGRLYPIHQQLYRAAPAKASDVHDIVTLPGLRIANAIIPSLWPMLMPGQPTKRPTYQPTILSISLQEKIMMILGWLILTRNQPTNQPTHQFLYHKKIMIQGSLSDRSWRRWRASSHLQQLMALAPNQRWWLNHP